MAGLARKEKVSIVQLTVAVLCIIDIILLMLVFRFPEDLRMFIFQCVLMGTAIVCILFGFSTWFYNSNVKCHRRHIRIYSVIVMWIFVILIIVSCTVFFVRVAGQVVFGHFENDIFDKRDRFLIIIGTVVGYIIAVLLICVNIYIILTKLRTKKKRDTRGGM